MIGALAVSPLGGQGGTPSARMALAFPSIAFSTPHLFPLLPPRPSPPPSPSAVRCVQCACAACRRAGGRVCTHECARAYVHACTCKCACTHMRGGRVVAGWWWGWCLCPFCIRACVHARLLACLPSCPNCLHAFMPACSHAANIFPVAVSTLSRHGPAASKERPISFRIGLLEG